MKKTILVLLVSIILSSCGGTKVIRQSKKVMKGAWELSSITYSESGNFNVRIFNDLTAACFKGSTWNFIPNNNSGSYTIDQGTCEPGTRNFIFKIQEINVQTDLYDFLLKPTDVNHKSDSNQGYRLWLEQLSAETMKWRQTVTLEGKPFHIYMNFNKIN
ncbi:MAG: lipocalin family protein [Flavobacteriaceae bacterium]|nr:lipocalin family protein [Flavobacteriaceae bacterium]